MTTPSTPIEVFYSYADADDALLNKLDRHLSQLRHTNRIVTLHRRNIQPGEDWQKAIDQYLNTASLILLLISSDFLASDYLAGVELQRALERHKQGEAHVIPILLRSCDWEDAPFTHLQMVPRNHLPLDLWSNLDEGLTCVAKEIRAALENDHVLPSDLDPTVPRRGQIWNIPYARNPFFTGREELLNDLHASLHRQQTTDLLQPQQISGLGGVGKTQLALEYAYRFRTQYEAVFWINAETRETLTSGSAGLALDLNLPLKDEQDQQSIVQAVTRWLQTHHNWLLILDNVEDLALLPPFLLPDLSGHVLLTTRIQVAGGSAHHLDISVLSEEEGILLLLKRAGLWNPHRALKPEIIEQARQISVELGHLPLALNQAGAYIEETRCSLRSYLQQYQQEPGFFLVRREQHPHPLAYPASVATTWSLSFRRVEQQSAMAAQILRFCAFLAPEAIPDTLVQYALASGKLTITTTPEQDQANAQPASPIRFDDLMGILLSYSLILRPPETETLTIHRLVQAVLRDTLSKEEQNAWAERAVKILEKALPENSFASWSQCEQYLPHAQECTQLIKADSIEQARVLHWTGAYLFDRQRAREAKPYVQKALQIREQLLGTEHLETAKSLESVALWWQWQEHYAEAEPLFQRALAIKEEQLGDDHLDTATSLNNLALLYQTQRRFTEAEPLFLRALTIREKHLGDGHTDTSTSLNNLASLYMSQERCAEAEPLFLRALVIREKQLGVEHLHVATILNNLAFLYRSQERDTEAEPRYLRALAIYEKHSDTNDVSQAMTLNNLAILYYNQERYVEAEPLFLRALAIKEQLLGTDHPDVALSLNNLAGLYYNQKRYTEAEPLFLRALAIKEQLLGTDHPDIIPSLTHLALTYHMQKRSIEAEALYLRYLVLAEKHQEIDQLDLATNLNNFARLYYDQGKYAQAMPLQERALAIRRQLLGKKHPATKVALTGYRTIYVAISEQEMKAMMRSFFSRWRGEKFGTNL
jgi:tetratricopeptide (TPR) repeat protein